MAIAMLPCKKARGEPGARSRRRGRSRRRHGTDQKHRTVVDGVTAIQRRRGAGGVGELAANHEVAVFIEINRFRVERREDQWRRHGPGSRNVAAEQRQDHLARTRTGADAVGTEENDPFATGAEVTSGPERGFERRNAPRRAGRGDARNRVQRGNAASRAKNLVTRAAVEFEENRRVAVAAVVSCRGPRRDQACNGQKS